jgi:hypothetical protein
MHRPLRNLVLPSPPADFPVYGLEPSWPGSRWLESFGDRIGDPVRWVRLGHRSRDGEASVWTESFSRPRTDAREIEVAPLRDIAHDAAHVLVNVTLPEHSEPLPGGFLKALADQAYASSQHCAQWPLVGWRVDGTAVSARVWRFAGGWAAVSDAVPGAYLAAVGLGADPDGLSLAVLRDGGACHFDLSQPLHPRMLSHGPSD